MFPRRCACALTNNESLGLKTMSLTETVRQSKEFGSWLHERTNQRSFPGDSRHRTGLSILQLSLDIADAIIVLLEAKLPGPALSLGRPLFEGYVRGKWLLDFASDQQVAEFVVGKCPKISGLMKAIPKDAESGGAWIHATGAMNLTPFHDLTHGGSEHVKRRWANDCVEPCYPEDESIRLLQLADEIRLRIGVELLSRLDDERTMDQLHEKAKSIRRL